MYLELPTRIFIRRLGDWIEVFDFDLGVKVMEVIASTSTVYHDIFVGEAGEGLDIEKPYPSDTYLINKVKELIKSSTTVIHQGQICTGDQFVTERAMLESIKQRFPEALAVDME